jgi:DNA-binding NarL/FixJ family response regulator
VTTARVADRRAIVAEQYESGRTAEEIAAEIGVSSATVRLDLRALGVTMKRCGPSRGSKKVIFTPAEVDARRARVAELAATGKGDREIARELGVSKTTIADDRRTLGLAPRPPGRPPKSPLPEERMCATCGRPFRPRRENVKDGGGFWCSRACWYQSEKRSGDSQEWIASVNTARARRIAELKAEGDYLTRSEVAKELEVSAPAVDYYVRQGYLAALIVEDIPGQRTKLFRRADVERFRRVWRRGDGDGKQHGHRANWLDPEFVVKMYWSRGILARRAREHGLSEEQWAAVVQHDVQKRARLFAAPRGRPKGSGPPDYHLEWAEHFEFRRAELQQQYEERLALDLLGLGEQPPTDSDAFLAVAEADFEAHPERWNDYSHAPGDAHAIRRDFEKPAIERIRKAVKALQIAPTEIP